MIESLINISVYDKLINVFKNFNSKVNEIYTDLNVKKNLIENQNNEKEDLGIEIKFDGFIDNLNKDINTFQDEARKRLTEEKLNFSSNIESIFVKGYNKTILDFMKGNGINELNLILNEDFSSTINNKFRYLKDEISHIKEYMIVLINSPDVKLISKKLSNSLKVIYNNIKNEFNDKSFNISLK